MSDINSPIKLQNLLLDGTWQRIKINQEYVAVSIQARGNNDLFISQPGANGVYYTIKAGSAFSMSSGNFSANEAEADYVDVKGINADYCEVIGFIRE